MDFLTGGEFKGTIHRVVQPPIDQQSLTRLGVFYFCMTDDDVRLTSLLKKYAHEKDGKAGESHDDNETDHQVAPTMRDWRRARTAAYGRSDLAKGKETNVEEESFHGIVVKHYS